MGPVENRNAVVVDELQTPSELMSKSSDEHLWNTYHAGEWWINVLEHFLQNFVVTRQRVFQLNLRQKRQQLKQILLIGNAEMKGHVNVINLNE